MTAIEEGGIAAFRSLYPDRPGLFAHGLREHELLTIPRLIEAANALPPTDIEHNLGDIAVEQDDPQAVPGNGLDPVRTLEMIEENRSWIALRNVEQLPEYRALTEGLLSDLGGVIEPATGEPYRHEAFVFVSSPGAVTPFHMDPEHNVLFQVRGTKTMTVFPAEDQRVVPDVLHERFVQGGHCNLPFEQDAIGALGTAFTFRPGEALHVPLLAPHFVENGDEVSMSLSVTWRSARSDRRRRVHLANHHARRLGLRPAPYGRHPGRDDAKAMIGRILARLG